MTEAQHCSTSLSLSLSLEDEQEASADRGRHRLFGAAPLEIFRRRSRTKTSLISRIHAPFLPSSSGAAQCDPSGSPFPSRFTHRQWPRCHLPRIRPGFNLHILSNSLPVYVELMRPIQLNISIFAGEGEFVYSVLLYSLMGRFCVSLFVFCYQNWRWISRFHGS